MKHEARILQEFYRAGTDGIVGATLQTNTRLDGEVIEATIRELRRKGFGIESHPYQGFCLSESPDILWDADLTARLGSATGIVGRQLLVVEETTSTNDEAERLALKEAPEGLVVLAEIQTRGRGRLGRTWHGRSGKSLLLSVLLRPAWRVAELPRLTIMGAVAVCRAVERLAAIRPAIKWPNDVMVEGRKLAGILTEMRAESYRVRYVVLGIGVNVNQEAAEFPTELTGRCESLRNLTGRTWNRAEVATHLLQELDQIYERVNEGRFKEVAAEWQDRCTTLGQWISVRSGSSRQTGFAESIDEEGGLLLRTGQGLLQRITSGDVTVIS